MSVINITPEQHGRFNTIMHENPQDSKASETFERILRFYEGKSVLPLQDMKEKQLAPTKNNEFMQLPERKL